MNNTSLHGTLMPKMYTIRDARLTTVDEMHDLVVGDTYADLVAQIRTAHASGEMTQVPNAKTGTTDEVPLVEVLKKRLPLYVPQGDVRHRRHIDGFWHPTPYIPIDFDHLTPEQMAEVVERSRRYPWVKEVHRSSRGEGLHLIVAMGVIPVTPCGQAPAADGFVPYVDKGQAAMYEAEYKRRYQLLCHWATRELGVESDPQCKDVLRGLFLSHDPEAYLLPDDEVELFPVDIETTSVSVPEKTPTVLAPTVVPPSPAPSGKVDNHLVEGYLAYHQYTPSHRHAWWIGWTQYLKYKGVAIESLTLYREAMRQHLSLHGLIKSDDPLLRDPSEVDKAMAWGYEHSTQGVADMTSVTPSVLVSDDELLERLRAIRLPRALAASIASQPPQVVLATLCGVLPAAQTYASAVSVRYCDGKLQRLNGMSCIVAEQSGLKSGVRDVLRHWLQPFKADDDAARQQKQEYKELRMTRKANEKLPPPPKVAVVVVPPTISCSALLKRFKQAEGRHLFSYCDEIDTVRKSNGAGSWSAKYDIYRMAFDNGEWGQDYNSDSSESGVVDVAYNWTFMGTPSAMRSCFAKNGAVENGLTGRVWHCVIPPNRFEHMPKYDMMDERQVEEIRQGTEILRMARGFVDTPKLCRSIERWCNQKADEANEANDVVVDTFRKRAAVIAFRAAVVFMLLENGQRWKDDGKAIEPDYVNHLSESPQCLKFALLVADHVLKYQCLLYGAQLLQDRRSLEAETRVINNQNTSMFESLPSEFTFQLLQELRPESRENTLRAMVKNWKKKGLIEKTGTNLWRKL